MARIIKARIEVPDRSALRRSASCNGSGMSTVVRIATTVFYHARHKPVIQDPRDQDDRASPGYAHPPTLKSAAENPIPSVRDRRLPHADFNPAQQEQILHERTQFPLPYQDLTRLPKATTRSRPDTNRHISKSPSALT